jgi:hypothetical protein
MMKLEQERLDTLFEQFEKYKLYSDEEIKLAREQASNPALREASSNPPQGPRSSSQTKERNMGRDSSGGWRKNYSADKFKYIEEKPEGHTKENLLRSLRGILDSFSGLQELHPAPTREVKGHYSWNYEGSAEPLLKMQVFGYPRVKCPTNCLLKLLM